MTPSYRNAVPRGTLVQRSLCAHSYASVLIAMVVIACLFVMSPVVKAQDVEFGFAASMGAAGRDHGEAIAVDSSGNVYTTGFFEGTADFDPGAGTANLTSAGSNDIFVQKLDSAGNFVWAKTMGGIDLNRAFGIAVDSSGNVYTTGDFEGTVGFDLGSTTLSGFGDATISWEFATNADILVTQLGYVDTGSAGLGSSHDAAPGLGARLHSLTRRSDGAL